jgi:hypothetical protein
MNKLQLSWEPGAFVIKDEDARLNFSKLEDREGFLGCFYHCEIEIDQIAVMAKELTLIAKMQEEIAGIEIDLNKEVPALEIFIPDIYPVPPYFEDDEHNVFIPDWDGLEQFAHEGGWAGIKDLSDDIGIEAADFLNCWFIIVHGRMYLKEE